MNLFTSTRIAFFGVQFSGIFTNTTFAFAPVNLNNSFPQKTIDSISSKLSYVRDDQIHAVTPILYNDNSVVSTTHSNKVKSCTLSIDNEDNDYLNDPMEEAFDNMQHPMELMLLNRACIPYVAM